MQGLRDGLDFGAGTGRLVTRIIHLVERQVVRNRQTGCSRRNRAHHAVVVLLALHLTSLAVVLSLLFGLIGIAPAGVIMSLTAEAMAPQHRAIGMGVFLSVYFVMVTITPPVAGWLFDRTGDPYTPIACAALLLVGGAIANVVCSPSQRKRASG